ncbi:MAG: hypothetical protein MSG64_17550 [Pyrinomonadaceae bacterium MAG19_C2-C3]|nr:hypothetical protein [Pyrinomonadaceae bacterium MAG19_C2-C3]
MPGATALKRKLNQPSKPSELRRKMLASIQIQWKQMRPDLHGDDAALRDERLAYVTDLLKLKKPLTSLSVLSDKQLGVVLDGFRRKLECPRAVEHKPPVVPSAEIIHLAGSEQVFTLGKLFNYLGWSVETRAEFVAERFKRPNPAMLSPRQANSLTMILLTIAAARDLKEQGVSQSRKDTNAYIPTLKSKLAIGERKN